MLEIKEFKNLENKEYWLEQINSSDWGAGHFLYKLLKSDTFREACGEKSDVLLLVDGDKLISFCTFAEKDDIQPTDLTPWVGFVYTFPEFRGNRYAGELLAYARELAAKEGIEYIYLSTNHIGLYEKYGYEFYEIQKDMDGEDSRVYRQKV